MKRAINIRVTRLALAGCALLLSNLAWADTAPLTGDSYINAGDANVYGALPGINIGGATNSQGLLLFDLSKLPAGVNGNSVTSAKLRFFVNKVTTSGSINISAANAVWSESTVNRRHTACSGTGNVDSDRNPGLTCQPVHHRRYDHAGEGVVERKPERRSHHYGE